MSTEGHDKSDSRQSQGPWTFLTNHSHVLVCLDRDPHVRLRDVADLVGITERAVQRIVMELETAGIIERQREGRRNVYRIDRGAQLRHPLEAHRTVGDLLDLVNTGSDPTDRDTAAEPAGRTARASV